MPDVYRIPIRDLDAAPLDDLDLDDGYTTTVRRYKVLPGRAERAERYDRSANRSEINVIERDNDRRISRSYAPRNSHAELIDMDRRVERIYLPDRPHSDEDQARSYTRSRSESRSSRDRERSISRSRAPNGDTYTRYKYRDDQARDDMYSEERFSEVKPGVWAISRERVVEDDRVDRHRHRHHSHHHHSHHRTPSAPSRTYIEREYVDVEDLDGDGVADYSRSVVERRAIGGGREAREDREYERTRKEKDERVVLERDRVDSSGRDHHTRLVYEKKKEVDRSSEVREPPRSPINVDVVERREQSLERSSDIRIERREEAPAMRGGPRGAYEEVYRKDMRKEVDVHEREEADAPPSIAMRSRQRDSQKIMVQEESGPAPVPVVFRERTAAARDVAVARRSSDLRDDEREDAYYYHHREAHGMDQREVGPYRGARAPEAYALQRINSGPRRLAPPAYVQRRWSDDRDQLTEDDGYYVRRTLIRREGQDRIVPGVGPGAATSRKKLHPHRKRHMAEGALAGAGLTALLTARRNEEGELPEHRGRKVIAGAALGAVGTEVARRAKSAFGDRYGSGSKSDSPPRSLSRPPGREGPGFGGPGFGGPGFGGPGFDRPKFDRPSFVRPDFDQPGYGLGKDSSPKRSHSRLKTGLGIAAVALAAAGAAKYIQQQKIEKEEATRGRSRNRRGGEDDDLFGSLDDDDDPDNKPPNPPGGRAASLAKVAAGSAAVVGLVEHFRNKSKNRNATSKERSKSRMKVAGEAVAAGIAGAFVKNTWDNYQEKKANAEARAAVDNLDDEDYEKELRDFVRNSSRSPSRSRTGLSPETAAAAAAAAAEAGAVPIDPELGMVEYGAHPLYAGPAPAAYPPYPPGPPGGPAGPAPGMPGAGPDDYDSAEEDRARARERRRRRRSRRRSRSRDEDDEYSADSEPETDAEYRRGKKKRGASGSRLGDMAAGAAAMGAAGAALHEMNERKGKGKARDEGGRERSRSRHDETGRDRDRDRQRYEDEIAAGDGYDDYDQRAPSPPTASGGAYYPPPAAGPGAANPGGGTAPPPQPGQGFTQHPNAATTNLPGEYRPYNPQDFNNLPPPPPGPPPNSAASLPPHSPGPDHVSEASRRRPDSQDRVAGGSGEAGPLTLQASPPPPPEPALSPSESSPTSKGPSKSVVFIPLSPQSSRTLLRHRQAQDKWRPGESDSEGTRERRRRSERGNRTTTRDDRDNSGSGSRHNHPDSDADDSDGNDKGNGRHSRRSPRINPRDVAGPPPPPPPAAPASSSSRRRSASLDSAGPPAVRPAARADDPGSDDSEIEVLPDRFDEQGQPLGRSSSAGASSRQQQAPWHSRRGDFAYQPRRGSNSGGGGGSGFQVRGEWGVAGTDPAAVDRFTRNMTGALDSSGRLNWLGLMTSILGGSGMLLGDEPGGAGADGGDDGGRDRRGSSSGLDGRRHSRRGGEDDRRDDRRDERRDERRGDRRSGERRSDRRDERRDDRRDDGRDDERGGDGGGRSDRRSGASRRSRGGRSGDDNQSDDGAEAGKKRRWRWFGRDRERED